MKAIVVRGGVGLIVAVGLLAFTSGPVSAHLIEVYSVDGPQDPLNVFGFVHELGTAATFPADELILSQDLGETNETACFDGQDDPAILNRLVSITNNTQRSWVNLYYVADPETTLTNFDGRIGNAPGGQQANDDTLAFRIDNVGINRPLVNESISADLVFQPNETWQFIIQDYLNAAGGPASAFDSLGIAVPARAGRPALGALSPMFRSPPPLSAWPQLC
jgi:hypothetical protein